jgi:hypothetical protein
MVRPKIEFLTKISGHQLIKNGDWETHLNGHLVCLRPEQNLVKLYVDGMLQQTSWAIESIPIKGDILTGVAESHGIVLRHIISCPTADGFGIAIWIVRSTRLERVFIIMQRILFSFSLLQSGGITENVRLLGLRLVI